MDYVRLSTLDEISPNRLRNEFGDSVAYEICKVMRVIDQNNDAIQFVLTALRDADTDERRLQIIETIWRRYYEKIATHAIEIS